MLHAGIGVTHVNALLTSINLPAVGQNTLKAREREVGPAIEAVARNSCLEGLQLEKECRRTGDTEQVVKIGVSYDMGWQKFGFWSIFTRISLPTKLSRYKGEF